MTGSILLHQPGEQCWLWFDQPLAVVTVDRLEAVAEAIAHLDGEVQRRGCYAAGFLSYEAAPAFDSALTVQPTAEGLPLLWFGLYDRPQILPPEALNRLDLRQAIAPEHAPNAPHPAQTYDLGTWQASVSPAEFSRAIATIKQAIARGDTFQVNYTFRLRASFEGDPWAFFQDLIKAQPGNYAAWVDTGEQVICSASPELFFQRRGHRITTRPMKGTAERGLWWQRDRARAEALQQSAKNRAENLMIVDMLRNDLGRIARLGSVQVPRLFELEQYPTLWQMTSTVTAESEAPMAELLRALFPCASITGAPKASTMALIRNLEDSPRGIYTGSIGYWRAPQVQPALQPQSSSRSRFPGDAQGLSEPVLDAQFNVAIRTVWIDRQRHQAEYGVGSGIVWDSDSNAEYEECCLKTAILAPSAQQGTDFELLETMLWQADTGFFLLDQHLERLARSADYFGFTLDPEELRQRLAQSAQAWETEQLNATTAPVMARRVRLLSDRQGQVQIQPTPWSPPPPGQPLRLKLCPHPIDSRSPWLYHKTTQRSLYEQARAQVTDCDDVLLWNERGEVTETAIANLVINWHGQLLTPPVSCGLLAGTFRAWLLAQGKLDEAVITLEMLQQVVQAEAPIFVINSLRRWQPAKLAAP